MKPDQWCRKKATLPRDMLAVSIGLAVLLLISSAEAATNSSNQFPKDFFLGVATSAYQIEGAWNTDGKGENIWDDVLHTQPNFTADGGNADVAADSYHKYQEDIDAVKHIGANMYRISVSWSRILPTGYANEINQAGIDYYNKVIDAMLAKNIEPCVTLYHFDLPQEIQDLGGWTNTEILVANFVDFARVCFEQFGDRVKYWATVNEPNVFSTGYASSGFQAPNVDAPGIGDYLTSYSVVKAHAQIWHMYDKEFRAKQNGKVGIVLNCEWQQADTGSTEDIEAAERKLQFQIGLFAHPIFSKEGDFPKVVRERVDRNSKQEGRTRSRLPYLTPEDVLYIKNSSDFFGLTHYSTHQIRNGSTGSIPSMTYDTGANSTFLDGYPLVESSTMNSIIPWGLRKVLNWLAESYPGFPFMIFENGCSDPGTLEDYERIAFLGCYMSEVLKAIREDGVDVRAYLIWSIIDNFEWSAGYTNKFGLYQVDMDDPQRTRTPKASVSFVKNIYESRTVPTEYFNANTSDLNSICYTTRNGKTSSSRVHSSTGTGRRVEQHASRHQQKGARRQQQQRRSQKPRQKQARVTHGNH